jgi:hypothetical protein
MKPPQRSLPRPRNRPLPSEEQTLARRRLDSLEDRLTVIADEIVDAVTHHLVTDIAEIKQQISDLKSR